MTTFKHPMGVTWRYDFVYKGRRYTGSTDQLTKADADLVEAQIKLRLRQNLWGIAPIDRERTPRFTNWAGHFLVHQRKRLTRPDILERTVRMVLAFFGAKPSNKPVKAPAPYHDLRLADLIIDPEWIEKFEQWMEQRDCSGATKNTYRSAVSGMYKLAMRPGWRKRTGITTNPMIGVERDRGRSRRITVTIEQLQAWITASPPHVRLAMAIGALAPELRLASILALRWDKNFDADLTFLTVHDHKTIRSTGEPQVVPIDPQLREILLPFQIAAKKAKKKHVIRFRGQPVETIRGALETAAIAAGIPYGRDDGATFHTLRHTMATLLAELGVPEKQRQLVMGHKDERTTNLYTHLRPLHKRQPLATLSAAVPLKASVQGGVQGPQDQTTTK